MNYHERELNGVHLKKIELELNGVQKFGHERELNAVQFFCELLIHWRAHKP